MAIKEMLLKELLYLSYIAVIHSYSTKKSEEKKIEKGGKKKPGKKLIISRQLKKHTEKLNKIQVTKSDGNYKNQQKSSLK